MKVLVTGGSGQVGKALLRTVPPAVSCVAPTRTELDLSSENSIRCYLEAERPELIINAGAYTAVDRAEQDEAIALAVNAGAVLAFRTWASTRSVRLVQVSTDYIFSGEASHPYPVHAPPAPVGAYGRTKLEGERAAGAGALIVRTSWVHAAGGANFVSTMLRLMRERDEISVVADQIGAPTWAQGLAQVIWSLVNMRETGIFHHRDSGAASWYDFAVAIGEEALALGLLARIPRIVPIATTDYPTPASRPAYSLLDVGKTVAKLGRHPPHWREALRSMLLEVKELG